MAIAGVVIVTKPEKMMYVLEKLNKTPKVTTYGAYNDGQIVAVLESDSSKGLEKISIEIQENIDGILGFYPTYVTNEDEIENLPEMENSVIEQ